MSNFGIGLSSIEQEAARRFESRRAIREERQSHLERMGKGGDWRKVDEPKRILKRLLDLGLDDLAAEAMLSTETRESYGETVPSVDVLERILGRDDSQGAAFIFDGACAARAVGRVIVRSASGSVRGFGTGFLVSPNLLLTNNHVLENATAAAPSTIQWDFYVRRDGSEAPTFECKLAPSKLFITSVALDFSLVAVEWPENDSRKNRGWLPMAGASGKAIVGEPVSIIQHPQGGPLKVALRANRILDVLDNFLHYETDTEPGSSGSPVLNDQWQLAALHHSGVPKRVNGVTTWVANEGVRISQIVTHLKTQASSLTAAQKQLLDEALAGQAPTDCGCKGTKSTSSPAEGQSSASGGGERPLSPKAEVDAQGNVTWVLPLRVTVGLGSAGVPTATPSTPPRDDRPLSDNSAVKSSSPPSVDDSPDFQQALAARRRHEDRPYYDATLDKQNATEYYDNIDTSANPRDFYKALSKLLKETHHRTVSYKQARLEHLYPWIDLQESGKLHSVYSNKPVDLEQLLRDEVMIESRREQQRREFFARESSVSEEAMEEFFDALEANEPFNCEHVVPQSWFNKKSPMVSDLHHLFTCETNCNSFRGNIPYFEFSDEVVRQECGRREEGKFEPKENKSAVARATLYFLLRYPGLIGNSSGELKSNRLGMLLDWHRLAKPSKWEKHRNAEIFAVQGNRNPLIDNPTWADKIDFRAGFGD
ncbi:MAG: endonuclease [Pirellulales bacterium]